MKVTPDFQTVNVFWVCKGDSTDAQTEELLNKIGGPLRAELSSLRVMGIVPYINFVKGKRKHAACLVRFHTPNGKRDFYQIHVI